MSKDSFMSEHYDALHKSKMQDKFKRIRPWPAGVVFIEWPGMTEEDIRERFKLMKSLGFNALKQVQTAPGTDRKRVMHIALEEGIIPWWYGEAGWEDPNPEHLRSIGLSDDMSIEALRENPLWLDRQTRLLHERVDREADPNTAIDVQSEAGGKRKSIDLPGVVRRREYGLEPGFAKMFTEWLKKRYGSVEALREAWHMGYTMVEARGWHTWAEVEADVIDTVNLERKEYCRMIDSVRFKTAILLEQTRIRMEESLEDEPNAPVRAGGEISLFLPMPNLCVDMEATADMLTKYGSFYPSIHISWHFEQTKFEFAKPVYMMSSIASDLFKGGWSATWESTGGPQILTGAGAEFYERMKEEPAGAIVDAGGIKQLLFSYIAGGFKGFGLWSFEPRITGWEGGEYGLLDSDCQLTDRAIAAGEIGRAGQKYRDELWASHKEPQIGVLFDWNNDALWCVLSRWGRSIYEYYPIFARIGSNRAFIDHNIPFEYVTAQNLREGLANRYAVIYVPAFLAFDSKLLPILEQYVRSGGRLVIDAPTAWYDIDGDVFVTREGTAFERLFGARLANYQYARESGRPKIIDGRRIEGFIADIVPTTASVVLRFDDGSPLMTERQLGEGTAVILGYGASLNCHMPGHDPDEALLCQAALGNLTPPYRCDQFAVYRICSEIADHYFLINDGPEAQSMLDTDRAYTNVSDAVTGETILLDMPIAVEGYSARWIRAKK